MKTFYTRDQIRKLLEGWGYPNAPLPTAKESAHLLYLRPDLRDTGHSHVQVSYGPLNGEKKRLYGVEFVNL